MQLANVGWGLSCFSRAYTSKFSPAVCAEAKRIAGKGRRVETMDGESEGAFSIETPDKKLFVVGHNKTKKEFYIKLTDGKSDNTSSG